MLFCCCSKCKVLEIRYEWLDSSAKDLDTGTTFLGTTVGWGCYYSGGDTARRYMHWSGDSTGSGSREVVYIEIKKALDDKAWSGSTTIHLAAGWYIPAGGSGPAKVVAVCRPDFTQSRSIGESQTIDISPGRQRGCAFTSVGSVVVSEKDGKITFKLGSNPLP
jgi:hypothetical protein